MNKYVLDRYKGLPIQGTPRRESSVYKWTHSYRVQHWEIIAICFILGKVFEEAEYKPLNHANGFI